MKRLQTTIVVLVMLSVLVLAVGFGRHVAIIQLEKTAKTAEADADLYRLSGNRIKGRQKLVESQKYYQLALYLDPGNVGILKRMARISSGHRLFSKSLEFSRKAASVAPGDAEVYYLEALAYKGLKKPDSAEDALKKAMNLKPDYYQARRLLAQLKTEQGKPAEGVELLEKNISNASDDSESYILLHNAYRQLGRLDKAVLTLEKALKLQKPPKEAYRLLILDYQELGRTGEIEGVLKNQLEKYPEDPLEHIKVARYFELTGKLSLAQDMYEKAAEIEKTSDKRGPPDDSNLQGHFYLGDFYFRHGRYEEAVKSLEKALVLKPDSRTVYFYLGLYYYEWGKYDEAKKELERCLSLDEVSATTLNMLSWLHLTAPKDDAVYDPKQALTLAVKAVSREPARSDYIDTMARAYFAEGRLDESMAAYRKNINAGKNVDLAMYGMAVCSYRKNDIKMGDAYLKEALRLKFNDWRLIRNDQDIPEVERNKDLRAILKDNQKGRR